MLLPTLNERTFSDAVERIKPSLLNGRFECAVLGISHKGRRETVCLKAGAEPAPELNGKAMLLASISKAITATAVARLVDQNIVAWSDPLSRYLPDMKDGSNNEKITIGDVFLHRTGYGDIDPVAPESTPSCQAYRNVIRQGFVIEPRTAFLYSTTTYWFMNALARQVLGFTSMNDFLQEWIFQPCGMTNTSFCPAADRRVALLDYYRGDELDRYMAAEVPGSGLWSTADDLLACGEAVIAPGRLMRPDTFEAMVEAYPLKKHGEEGFACRTLGWVREINFNNQPLRGFFHGGATGGVLWCDAAANFVAVFMSNKWGSDNSDAFKMIAGFYDD